MDLEYIIPLVSMEMNSIPFYLGDCFFKNLTQTFKWASSRILLSAWVLKSPLKFRQLAAFSKSYENISITTNKNALEESGALTFCIQVLEQQNVFLFVLF